MTEKRPHDDEDERETIAGGSPPSKPGESSGGDAGTDADFDLHSLPGRRPAASAPSQSKGGAPNPQSRGSSRKLPDADDPFDDPPPAQESRPGTQPASPGVSVPAWTIPAANPAAHPPARPPSTETPTAEVEVDREMATIAGSFAASAAPQRPTEAETIIEPDSSKAPAAQPRRATEHAPESPLARARGPRPAGHTARDPAAGTAAARGTDAGAASREPITLREGMLLAERYELLERLGKGGMGEVWKAKHTLLQGMRAIKVIKASISRDPEFRKRFLREGQTMMRVKHGGVVEVTDLDETRANHELFMVMEYLKGRTIYDAIRSNERPLGADVRDAVRILREVAIGMQRIHDERIVHKDLKSDNVLLVKGDDGLEHPKVIDFGLAKSLGDKDGEAGRPMSPAPGADPDLHTTLSGTLAYMAPEQFRSEPSSFRSDIYAFGVMGYETFMKGEYPLPRGSLPQYMLLHKDGKVPDKLSAKRRDLDPDLTAILDRCYAPKWEDRPESFGVVAADLQYWLDKPVRAAKRKQLLMGVGGAAALVAIAVWGFFFSGKTATLSNPAFLAGPARFVPADGKVYLPESALAKLEVTADVAGSPGTATLEIDNKPHPVTARFADDKLTAAIDLHGLPDGDHSFALRPAANASPVNAVVVVDRRPPKIRAIAVKGGVVSSAGVFTNSQAPEVVIDLEEPADRIASVKAVPADGTAPVEAQREGGSWVLKGTARSDGKVEFDVVSRDLAGNEDKQRFAYERDTQKPTVTIDDVFSFREIPVGLHLRQQEGAKLRVTVDEATEVSAKFGDADPQVKRLATGGAAEFAVPGLEEGRRIPLAVSVRDAAGNVVERRLDAGVLPDVVGLVDSKGARTLAVKGDGADLPPDQQPVLIVYRTYPLGPRVQLFARRIRAADGADVASEAPHPVELRLWRTTDEGHTNVYGVPSGTFTDGAYAVTASVAGDPEVRPLEVIHDSAAPEVAPLTVTCGAAAVPAGGFALSQKLEIRAEVADLAPSRIELDGSKPAEPLQPGRHTYTFVKTLEAEGPHTFTLAVTDAAGHGVERSVTVVGDWSTPSFDLTQPLGDVALRDNTEVVFAGTCSEPSFKFHVDLPDGRTRTTNCDTRDLSTRFLLPAGDPLAIGVWVEDAAGHRSAVQQVKLTVVHVASELPPEITWNGGVLPLMEKVEPGDVVIGGRVLPVARVFLDRTEVTNADYRAFLAAGKGGHGPWCHPDEPKGWDHAPSAVTWNDPKWNAAELPVVNVSYWDAFAFAGWSGRRLPSESEWVMAASRPKAKDETDPRAWPPFPLGQWKDGVLATSELVKGPVPAASGADASPAGCLHMGGNVSEWVEVGAAPGVAAFVGTRGGNWFYGRRAADVTGTRAKKWDPSFRADTIGFRCAVDASKVQP